MIARIYRGLPSSGKTTAAKNAVAAEAMVAADDFRDYTLPYDATRNAYAHESCFAKWLRLVRSQHEIIAVHNTFVTRDEMRRYIDAAKARGRTVEIIDLFDGGLTDSQLAERSSHDVPCDVIAQMRSRYEIV